MIGKAVCLLVVLVIASQASEITTGQEVSSHLDSDVGPGTVLAEVSASARGDGLRDLSKSYETFAVDDMDDDVDGSRIDDYEEERREEKRRRREAARRRSEKRRKERRERRRAAKAERKRKRKARKAARRLARAMRKDVKIGAMAKQGMNSNPNATAAALTRVLFPSANGTNRTNGTNSTSNYTIDPKIIERHLRQAEMTKADLKLYKKYKKAQRSVRKHKSKERYYKARGESYATWKRQQKAALRRKMNLGRTDWAVRQGMAAIKSLQGELESEDVRKDKLFWDQYYGRKRLQGRGDKQPKKDTAKTVATLSKDDKHVDLALPLYKASHIASFKQASGRSKKFKNLDNNLKEDGDKYIEYSINYA